MLRTLSAFTFLLLGASATMWAYSSGADPRNTGAPGDSNCSSCHLGTALNKGGGSIAILLAGDATYTPGVKQRITIKLADTGQRRWGFELTARLNSDLSNGQAGTLATAGDGQTQVLCDRTGRNAPCPTPATVQFATHTTAGTKNGTTGGLSFSIDWTPPAADAGKITLYAAGNAANGNGADTGDHIYTAFLELSPASATPTAAVTNVASAASLAPGTAPASWITISGTNLSSTTRTWTADEAKAGLPTALDGVSVQVNGKGAYVQSISPTQVTALTPSDSSTGPVSVVVNNNGTAAPAAIVVMAPLAPALLVASDNKYLVTSRGDNPLAGRVDHFPSASFPAPVGVQAGDVVSFYGSGFGPVDPAITDGVLQAASSAMTTPLTLTIGGRTVQTSFAGLAPGFAGVYQFKTTVPVDIGAGDQQVVIQAGGLSTQSSPDCCFLKVAATPKPVITSTVSAGSQAAGTAPGSWIAIMGTNLAYSSRTWSVAEATATTGLPASLDGVSVQVNNIAAYVQAVSPTQLLVLTPTDGTTGQVDLVVTNNGQTADAFSVTAAAIAPALFTADGKYLVTTHAATALDKRLDVYPATSAWPAITWPAPTPAKPGETIISPIMTPLRQ